MAKIRQLPKVVANQISAGEVIERPASVVKELVENAIDAGSSKILIEIENGGREKIRVKDNGFGIAEDELELAFSRYATSKIEKVNDLYSIKTLGFRGEALSSIVSVAKVEINSKTNDQLKGMRMKLEGSKVISKESVGIPQGTDIIVNDLFYNTPARFKYLKTTNTEFGHISNVINREALAFPGIQFELIHNKHQVLITPGTGKLLDTIFSIYGQELVDKLIPIDYEENYIKLNGYLANPNYYRFSRVYELFFVNNRTVYSRILSRGVEEGYRGLLPPRSYPVVFLFLKLNQILIDVNIHPTKREIKFSRNEIIKDVIKNGIKTSLKIGDRSPRIEIKPKNNFPKEKIEPTIFSLAEGKQDYSRSKNLLKVVKEDKSDQDNCLVWGEKNKTSKEGKSKKKIQDRIEQKVTKEFNASYSENLIKRVLGQIHNTYIIAEGRDGLYIIDQHNAHERVLYEGFKKKYQKNKVISQPLLVPLSIETTLPEMEIINKYMDELNRIGLKLESFGGKSFILQEVPLIMKKRSSKKALREIIDKLLIEGKTMNQAEIIDKIITYMSCRGAIKAGMSLGKKEMEELVRNLFQTANPYRCPHGRQIIIHLSEDDLARGMGRK